MRSAAKQTLSSTRLSGYTGRGDKYLGDIAQDLRRVLWKTQNTFAHGTCRLRDIAWSEVAVLLVEWAEDVHNDLGLWRTVEAYQRQCFGTALPFIAGPADAEPQGFDARRIQYLLWNLWICFNRELVLSPTHQDLKRLAEVASRFLDERFARVPRDSGLKRFLATPNDYGWDVKRKLFWAGISSYLFRFLFFKYLDDEKRDPDIAAKDDFVCAHCTEWAGLGAIDVLAGALDLPERDRATLRSWYERHRSFFRVLSRHEEGGEVKTITARNLVNGCPYTIRMNVGQCPFLPGMVVYGALTPWRDEWYWSGAQETFENLPEHEEANIRKEMLETASAMAYRYCPDEAQQGRELIRELHAKFVAYYGSDLVSFPDGLALTAAEQKRMQGEWAEKPEQAARIMAERGFDQAGPRMKLSPEFLNHDQGIGAFSNPEEGEEFMLGFNRLVSAFRKRGRELTENELHAVRGFIVNAASSPAFVRRLAYEHGAETIAETFLVRDWPPEATLEVLLRRHKGRFFRKRYPSLSLLQPIHPSAETQKGQVYAR
ncbi:MAG: hypothetical protein C5B50_09005 [Verrucomicrobia bacterium]|nr:MAG: hypothetical protein C5B50_09005 [Verrucomicrobiota bacterium]